MIKYYVLFGDMFSFEVGVVGDAGLGDYGVMFDTRLEALRHAEACLRDYKRELTSQIRRAYGMRRRAEQKAARS